MDKKQLKRLPVGIQTFEKVIASKRSGWNILC